MVSGIEAVLEVSAISVALVSEENVDEISSEVSEAEPIMVLSEEGVTLDVEALSELASAEVSRVLETSRLDVDSLRAAVSSAVVSGVEIVSVDSDVSPADDVIDSEVSDSNVELDSRDELVAPEDVISLEVVVASDCTKLLASEELAVSMPVPVSSGLVATSDAVDSSEGASDDGVGVSGDTVASAEASPVSEDETVADVVVISEEDNVCSDEVSDSVKTVVLVSLMTSVMVSFAPGDVSEALLSVDEGFVLAVVSLVFSLSEELTGLVCVSVSSVDVSEALLLGPVLTSLKSDSLDETSDDVASPATGSEVVSLVVISKVDVARSDEVSDVMSTADSNVVWLTIESRDVRSKVAVDASESSSKVVLLDANSVVGSVSEVWLEDAPVLDSLDGRSP